MDSLAMRSKLTAVFDADLFALQSVLRILDIDCVSAAFPTTGQYIAAAGFFLGAIATAGATSAFRGF